MIGQEIVEKQYVAVGKASTFVSLRPKGTIMVDGSTSIAPLMEVINVCTVAQLRTSLLLKSLEGRSDLIIGFSLLNCLEFFVFRKMKSSSTINHPLCGCESNVIQKKLPFRVQ